MEFKTITTQEELDAVIGERLKRERETIAKKYADYDQLKERATTLEEELGQSKNALEEFKKEKATYDEQVEGLTSQVRKYETAALKSRIAIETGIPYEMAARLSGEDEKAIREDAKQLSSLISKTKPTAPLKSSEPTASTSETAYKQLLNNLKLEGE